MNIFERSYTLKSRPEVKLTNSEIWEVYHYCQALNGLDSLLCWLENETCDGDPTDAELAELIKIAEAKIENIDLGAEIWEDFMDVCTYDMGYEEMQSVVRCLRDRMEL